MALGSLRRVAPAIVIALFGAVQPQSVQPQSTQNQSGTATITGTVVTLSTGEPIAEATVKLYASTLRVNPMSTTTDSQGRFQFTDLATGRYTVGAEKKGFVLVNFGERHYGRGGNPIPLHDAEHRDIRILLPHSNAITGRIVDENGNPAVGASVEVMRFSMAWGYRRALPIGSVNTDSRGIFRIQSLTPGDYAVCASTRQTAPLNEGQQLQADIDRQRRGVVYVLGPKGIEEQKALAPHLAQLEARLPPFMPPVRGYAPVCYGGTASRLSTITLAPDEQRSGVDMQFALTRLARIEGIVRGMPPDNRSLDPIMLLNLDDDVRAVAPAETTRPDFEGRFRFTNIPPGRYQLYLRDARGQLSVPTPSRLSATADVVVGDQDIRNVVLDLQPGVTVSGKLVFRGAGPAPSAELMARASWEIRLDPADPGPANRYPPLSITRPDPAGQFVFHDVFSGRYRITWTQRETTGWLTDTSKVPGADVAGQLLEVKREDITGVTVTMTDQRTRTEVSGTIMTDKGEPAPAYVIILLYPVDERYWSLYSGRLYVTRAKEDGTFVMNGLQPGQYRLATLLDAEWGAWFDPAYLHRIDAAAMPLTITDDEKKGLTLVVPGDR